MRRPLVAGNWKMNLVTEDAMRFIHGLPELREAHPGVDLLLFPPLTLLMVLARALSGTRVAVGAQNCHWMESGAFTGEVSAPMLRDAGATCALVGHSERRSLFGETDDHVRLKLHAVLEAGLEAVLCVGETQDERDEGRTEEVLARQLEIPLSGLVPGEATRLTVAYEPTWAIGTGRTASPEQAQHAHSFVRRALAGLLGEGEAAPVRVLYGGSIRPDNAAAIFAQPDVDGCLAGGASLRFDSFAALVEAAARA